MILPRRSDSGGCRGKVDLLLRLYFGIHDSLQSEPFGRTGVRSGVRQANTNVRLLSGGEPIAGPEKNRKMAIGALEVQISLMVIEREA